MNRMTLTQPLIAPQRVALRTQHRSIKGLPLTSLLPVIVGSEGQFCLAPLPKVQVISLRMSCVAEACHNSRACNKKFHRMLPEVLEKIIRGVMS